jgi:hypothetical protein
MAEHTEYPVFGEPLPLVSGYSYNLLTKEIKYATGFAKPNKSLDEIFDSYEDATEAPEPPGGESSER